MELLTPALALAYLGSALGVAMVAPQISRIVRHPHLEGVSVWRWSITVVACSLWLAYGVRTGSLPQIPGNVLLISGAVAIVLLVPSSWSRRRRAAAVAAVAVALIAASTRLTPEQVGFLAFGIGITGMWPQVYETVWVRRGLGASSLSLTSTALGLVSQTLWLGFAVLTVDLPVIVAAVVALTTNATVTLVEASRRRPQPDVAATVVRELDPACA